MKLIKLRIAHATIAGDEGIIITSVDKDDNKLCMTFVQLDDVGTADFIVTDNGELTSENEPLYEQLIDEFER